MNHNYKSTRRARSGSGCRFESGYGPVIYVAVTIFITLGTLNKIQEFVCSLQEMIEKAVVSMCAMWSEIKSGMTVLTGGVPAWTGRDER